MYFAQRVKSGGIWNYKSYMGTNTIYYIEDLNTNMTGETIGNFYYGYVGRAVFEAATLKSAAGMYQIISKTSSWGYWDSFFDNPSDQHDIEWGIRCTSVNISYIFASYHSSTPPIFCTCIEVVALPIIPQEQRCQQKSRLYHNYFVCIHYISQNLLKLRKKIKYNRNVVCKKIQCVSL